MKRKTAIFLAVLFCAVALMPSCGNETPEESITYRDVSELTSAPESVTSSENADMTAEVTEQPETSGQTETEFSVDDLALPEAVDISKCKIIPEDFSDHSAQLAKLGYTEGTDDYKLYNMLLDVSCQLASYRRYPNRSRTSFDEITRRYYRAYCDEITGIVNDLLFRYDIGLAPNEILPAQLELSDRKTISETAYNDEMISAWRENNYRIKDAVIDLQEFFSSDMLRDYEYSAAMLALLAATLDKIAYAEPYVDDPLCNDMFELKEEYDETLNMVRITVTTTCKIDEMTYPGLLNDGVRGSSFSNVSGMTDVTFESCTESEDGITTLVILIGPYAAFNNCVKDYYIYQGNRIIYLINHIGLQISYCYHSDYPYFLYPGVDWDEPVRVQDEHLHTALTRYFRDLKGIEGYTRRDLSLITKLEIVKDRRKDENGEPTGEKYSRIYLYLATNLCKIYYPYYEENGEHGALGGLLPPASQYYTVEGEWIEDIPQSDMDLFIALGY